MATRHDMTALVIGGGVAGPVAAMALQRAGVRATIFEAYRPSSVDVGSYLTVATNGIGPLETIGVRESVLKAGFPTPSNVLIDATGRRLGTVSNGGMLPDGTVAHTIKRATLSRILREEAARRGIRIEHGKRMITAEQSADGRVVAGFDDGTDATGDVLVGSDGIHSTTRRIIDPGAPTRRYVGLTNFGGYTEGMSLDAEPGTWHMMFGKRAFFGYVLDPSGGTVWFANVPRSPISTEERDSTANEQWSKQLIELFAHDHGPAAELIASGRLEFAADNTHDLPSVPRWHSGGMVIIGDAAHAPSPTSGQGASMAIEDAVVLAKCVRDAAAVSAALAAYEQIRRSRVERIVAQGARTTRTKTPGPLGRALSSALLPIAFKVFVTDKKLAWLYDHRIDWDTPINGEVAHV